MRHFCTYFDGRFLLQGLALVQSINEHHEKATTWVLVLDQFAENALRTLGDPRIQIVPLHRLENADPGLKETRGTRTLIEYYFTVSPCWPRYLLNTWPVIDLLTYVDADMLFHGSLESVLAEFADGPASVLITEHRFPQKLRTHYERHGRYNVGILIYKNNGDALTVLENWRSRCLEWCFDEVMEGRYADQGYLDQWPSVFGEKVSVLTHTGVNLAPWNWLSQSVKITKHSKVEADARPLIIFHYARFRPIYGTRLWQSGQLDYGIMPYALRRAIYGKYYRALFNAKTKLAERGINVSFTRRTARSGRAAFKQAILGILFGADWLRCGNTFLSLGFGAGRYSGLGLALLRKFFRA